MAPLMRSRYTRAVARTSLYDDIPPLGGGTGKASDDNLNSRLGRAISSRIWFGGASPYHVAKVVDGYTGPGLRRGRRHGQQT